MQILVLSVKVEELFKLVYNCQVIEVGERRETETHQNNSNIGLFQHLAVDRPSTFSLIYTHAKCKYQNS